MTDSFGYTSPQEADSTVIPSLSRSLCWACRSNLKALVMREIPFGRLRAGSRQARNDSKDFYRITLTQTKESVIVCGTFCEDAIILHSAVGKLRNTRKARKDQWIWEYWGWCILLELSPIGWSLHEWRIGWNVLILLLPFRVFRVFRSWTALSRIIRFVPKKHIATGPKDLWLVRGICAWRMDVDGSATGAVCPNA